MILQYIIVILSKLYLAKEKNIPLDCICVLALSLLLWKEISILVSKPGSR